jgi:hypothetical protein
MTPSLPRHEPSDDFGRELQATLAARREIGQEYDDQFVARLADQLTARVRQEAARAPRPHHLGLSPEQRTAVAICSLVFGIPLTAIAADAAGGVGVFVAFVALVLFNIAAGITW